MFEFAYAVTIVALTCLLAFGVIYAFMALFRIRDYLREVCADSSNPWLTRILVAPFYLLFAAICLPFAILGILAIFWFLKDVRDWWHKD